MTGKAGNPVLASHRISKPNGNQGLILFTSEGTHILDAAVWLSTTRYVSILVSVPSLSESKVPL